MMPQHTEYMRSSYVKNKNALMFNINTRGINLQPAYNNTLIW